jgi:hypothetical protein
VVFAYRSEIDVWLHRESADTGISPLAAASVAQPIIPPATDASDWHAPLRTAAFLRPTVIGVILAAASLVVFGLRSQRASGIGGSEPMPKPLLEPHIASVTPILPRPDQRIVIKGRDFGWYTAFDGLDTPYLAIRDVTGNWAAGRIIDRNPDDVTLAVEKWNDSEIVITGLLGKYGQGNWKLQPGDGIDVAVWNPQTGAGPGIFHVVCRDAGR